MPLKLIASLDLSYKIAFSTKRVLWIFDLIDSVLNLKANLYQIVSMKGYVKTENFPQSQTINQYILFMLNVSYV